MEMVLDAEDHINFTLRGNTVHFHFPTLDSIVDTRDTFCETIILLRDLPGFGNNDNIFFTEKTGAERIPLFGVSPDTGTDTN